MSDLSFSRLAALAILAALAGCAKDKEPRACNAGTLLLEFRCDQDLKDASELRFLLARGEDRGTEFTTALSCPGLRRYEVAIGDYAAMQRFRLSATPMSNGAPLGQPNLLEGIELDSGCTRVEVLLNAGGNMPTPEEDAAVQTPPEDGAAPEQKLDASEERGPKNRGESCSSGSECQTGFCADGVCCESACAGSCFSCALQGSMGSCLPTPDGVAPAMPKQCATQPVEMCGLDGKCDGAGSCRRYPDGTVCAQGVCEGTGSRERKVCAGGGCSAEKNLTCGTFLCDPASVTCFAVCETDAQCEPGKACKIDPDTNKKSCGKKLIGASCELGGECETGFCADGVCCNQACTGACLSCDQLNKVGSCSPVPAGADDKRNVCKATDVAGCGETGKCDGNGACAKFAKGTVCAGAMCSGNDGVPASECDGNGTCVAGKPFACAPNVCRGNACLDKCMVDADCTGGAVCTNGSCGLKPLGASCSNEGECASGQCADGVCCDKACTGTCEYCAFSTNRGKCVSVPAGDDDPRDDCKAKDPSTCSENGKCNGSGACQLYGEGTQCSDQSCNAASNMQVYAKQCDGLGTCKKVREDTPCTPHTCSGNACADSCSRDEQCVAPNSCVLSLCGKRKPGQVCSNNDQCASGYCTSEGVCCTSPCSGTCRSCRVAGKEGTCSDVPAGQDPLDQCEAMMNSTCGTAGTCDGAGKCALYGNGVICAGATCSADKSKEIGASTCDGAGKCLAPAGNTCQSDLVCSGSACKASCSTDADCRNGKKCNTRTKQCGLADGVGCGSNADCGSDKCVDGYCCNSDCSGACESCAAKDTGGMNGVCAALPNGASDAACPGASCSADKKMATPASTCDGARKCTTPMTKSCGEFTCSNGVCLETCTTNTDCLDSSKECKATQCKKKLGVSCSAAGECASGFCAPDGVCCENACTGACRTCDAMGKCNLLSGSYPSECAPSACGFSGQCVSGACQTVANGTSCGAASCKDSSSEVSAPTCNNGQCQTPNPTACTPGTCKGSACSSSCSGDNDCASGAYCDGTTCKAKKTQGTSCGATKECSAGLTCVNDVCCESTCGSACTACSKAFTGLADGLCRARTSGTSDSRCNDSSSCGHTGTCNGQGACVYKGSETQCRAASCLASGLFTPAETCKGTGDACANNTLQCPSALGCTSSGCRTTCSTNSECAAGYTCAQSECWKTWITAVPGTSQINDLAVAGDGSVYAVGLQNGSVTVGGRTLVHDGDDVILVKFSSTGVAEWARNVTATGSPTRLAQVVVDAQGNVHLLGLSSRAVSIATETSGAPLAAVAGLYWAKYNSSGGMISGFPVSVPCSSTQGLQAALRSDGLIVASVAGGCQFPNGTTPSLSGMMLLGTNGTLVSSKSSLEVFFPESNSSAGVWAMSSNDGEETLHYFDTSLNRTENPYPGDVSRFYVEGASLLIVGTGPLATSEALVRKHVPTGAVLGGHVWEKKTSPGYFTAITGIGDASSILYVVGQGAFSVDGRTVQRGNYGVGIARLDANGNVGGIAALTVDTSSTPYFYAFGWNGRVSAMGGQFSGTGQLGGQTVSSTTTVGVVVGISR